MLTVISIFVFAGLWMYLHWYKHDSLTLWQICKSFCLGFMTVLTGVMLYVAFINTEYKIAYIVIFGIGAALNITVAYFLISGGQNRRKLLSALERERKQRVQEIKETGFKPTKKFLGSGRMFAIDEDRGEWYIMNYYNCPGATKVHKISSIRGVEKASNKEYAQIGGGFILNNGAVINSSQIKSYYTKLGVLIKLDDKDCPTEFINCYESESEADDILSYVEILIDEHKK